MQNSYIVEIAVDSLGKALAAARGGAQRIELCSDLSQGGLTPDVELMRSTREQVRLPIFSMIRPRGGDFVYSDVEFAEMKRDIATAQRMRMDGVVLGILKRDCSVDSERTWQLVELARPLPVTFHRAFDVLANLRDALEAIIKTGSIRLLTSGGMATAFEGLPRLADLVRAADGRIEVMPGSGITSANVVMIAEASGAREFHAGLSSVVHGGDPRDKRFEEEVQKLVRAVEALGPKRC